MERSSKTTLGAIMQRPRWTLTRGREGCAGGGIPIGATAQRVRGAARGLAVAAVPVELPVAQGDADRGLRD